MQNPFTSTYNTPYEVPPFGDIRIEHFQPAFNSAIEKHRAEIQAIVENKTAPNFDNTIAALDYSGNDLNKVARVFYNYLSANTSKELQSLAIDISPLLTQHSDNINLNQDLFKKVKSVYEQKEELGLNNEQKMLLDKTYKSFVRGGADLPEKDKERFRAINERMSVLTLNFGNNVLAEINNFELIVENEQDLSGLSEDMIAQAAATAKERGYEGKWVFTIHVPVYEPFMASADNRDLRQKMYKAYTEKANHNNELDNKEIIKEIVQLRAEKAQLLGYSNHAAFVLEETMAKTPEQVNERLINLWKASQKIVQEEQKSLQELADTEGDNIQIEAWDWAYYAEKLKSKKYNFNENAFRPYLPLDEVTKGVFLACKNLFGLKFVERKDIPTYHADAIAYEVQEANGTTIGILFMDYFTRDSKRGGAWMTSYRKQRIELDGEKTLPIISIVFNFSRPTGGAQALLNIEEMTTYYHEFGHALHGLLSNVQYPTLSGTSVSRDFVEFPSQFFENWGLDPDFLKQFAKHHETGEVIPDSLIQKYINAGKFNQGFRTTEYLAASILDMNYHTLTGNAKIDDVTEFETQAMGNIQLTDAIPPRYRSTYFNHIFSGGYSAGYYSYIWSEMLDADAFAYFKEKGIFDQTTAKSYRQNILEKGATEEPMQLYIKFRGQEPSIEPLLEKRGLTGK